jgi:hypothetical protein
MATGMESLLLAAQLQYAQLGQAQLAQQAQLQQLAAAQQQQFAQLAAGQPAAAASAGARPGALPQKGVGKGKDKAAAAPESTGIPGLQEALMEALAPVAHMDSQWDIDEMVKRVHSYFTKAAKKYETDERAAGRGTAVQAQALIEEFVSTALGAVGAACYEKVWFTEADFSGALMVTAMYTFRGGKLFCRTLGPVLKRYVDDGVFRYREEERIQKAMWDAVSISGLAEGYQKKAAKHLQLAYDEAHMSAPYGSTSASTPEMGLVQDFVKCWMTEFVSRSWDVLENGVVGGKDEQFAFMTTLFQYLTDPDRSCLPHDLTAQLEAPPPESWGFIGELAMKIFTDMEEAAEQKRQRKNAYKQGGGKGW